MIFRLASAGALAAAASMVATPIAAAEPSRTAMPIAVGAPAVFDADAVNADGYRRWHRRDRVDAGDVIAGVLVLGTIAAVASAASKASRERDYRYPQRYPSAGDRYDYRAAPNAPYDTRGGIDRAVDTCAREIERNVRIDTVDGVDRYGAGWRVSGRLSDGAPFTCAIDGSGPSKAWTMAVSAQSRTASGTMTGTLPRARLRVGQCPPIPADRSATMLRMTGATRPVRRPTFRTDR